MSNNNKAKFIEDSSAHIININRVLKNIKSKVIADFIQSNQASIIIATNKVAAPLNIQTIEQYIKNMNHIKIDNVEVSHLPQSTKNHRYPLST